MNFDFAQINAAYLFFAVLVFMLLFIYNSRRRWRILELFLSSDDAAKKNIHKQISLRRILTVIYSIGLIFLILALMRPQFGYETREIRHRGSDLFFVVDVSQSMMAEDVSPSRIQRAKRELLDLLSYLKGDRVGLIAFSGKAYVLCPLTNDYQTMALFINDLDTNLINTGGTDIKGAIQTAIDGFEDKSSASNAVILLTDGEVTQGDSKDLIDKAENKNVTIYVMGLGSTEGAPIPGQSDGGFIKDAENKIVLSKLDETSLKGLATTTGGIYVRSVVSDDDIKTLYFEGVRVRIDQKEQQGGKEEIPLERYAWPLFISILLLLWDIFYK